ncbi:MAG TPA: A24 family peptidase [Rhizomicrobium sp.]|jgi:leader peptidase (prepilin peptidase)/N-methyltransferase
MAVIPLWLPLLVASPFIGSFLGTLIQRLPERRPVLLGRSQCDRCHATLTARDLVPLASFAVLRGRCRHCGASIGWFAPVLELAAMAVVLWAMTETAGTVLIASCVFGWLLLALAVTDWRVYLLPDPLTFTLALTGLIATGFIAPENMLDHVIAMLAGLAVFALIAFLYRRLRGREGLGFGDAKLLGALGAWVSWQGLPSVVLCATVTGMVLVLVLSLSGRKLSATTRIPFGTFLALGGWIVWLYGPLNLPSP